MNSKTPLVSVLMPVYNAMPYLDEAISSVLNQTFSDFEFIIINDGSTDGSGTLLESYKNKDSRLKIYHIENSGVAHARNLAISQAKGSYIAFIDSDDKVNNDYLQVLYEYIVKYSADISMCAFYRFTETDHTFRFHCSENEDNDTILFNGIESYQAYYRSNYGLNYSLPVIWGKLIKKELFDGIFFPNGKVFEDSYTMYKVHLLAQRIVFTKKNLYMYRIRPQSIMTSNWTKDMIRNNIEHHEERFALLSTLQIPITEDHIADYIATLYACSNRALDAGYIDEYKWLMQKIDFINHYKQKP